MNTEYEQFNQVVDRYVGGLLEEPERSEFEIYLLDHPELAVDVDYASGFFRSIKRLENDENYFSTERKQSVEKRSLFSNRRSAIAATFVLVVCGALFPMFYQHSSNLSSEIERLKSPVVLTEEIWLESTRSGSGPRFTIPEDTGLILRVDAGPAQSVPLSVALEAIDSDYYWSRDNLQADSEQSIRLQLANVPPGRYRLVVSKKDVSEPIIVHKFVLDAKNR